MFQNEKGIKFVPGEQCVDVYLSGTDGIPSIRFLQCAEAIAEIVVVLPDTKLYLVGEYRFAEPTPDVMHSWERTFTEHLGHYVHNNQIGPHYSHSQVKVRDIMGNRIRHEITLGEKRLVLTLEVDVEGDNPWVATISQCRDHPDHGPLLLVFEVLDSNLDPDDADIAMMLTTLLRKRAAGDCIHGLVDHWYGYPEMRHRGGNYVEFTLNGKRLIWGERYQDMVNHDHPDLHFQHGAIESVHARARIEQEIDIDVLLGSRSRLAFTPAALDEAIDAALPGKRAQWEQKTLPVAVIREIHHQLLYGAGSTLANYWIPILLRLRLLVPYVGNKTHMRVMANSLINEIQGRATDHLPTHRLETLAEERRAILLIVDRWFSLLGRD